MEVSRLAIKLAAEDLSVTVELENIGQYVMLCIECERSRSHRYRRAFQPLDMDFHVNEVSRVVVKKIGVRSVAQESVRIPCINMVFADNLVGLYRLIPNLFIVEAIKDYCFTLRADKIGKGDVKCTGVGVPTFCCAESALWIT